MKLGELEKEAKEELGQELKELAKIMMRDEYIKFNNAKKHFDTVEDEYNKLLDSEITEELLRSKGHRIEESFYKK